MVDMTDESSLRRFIFVGTTEEKDRLESLAKEKSLSREDFVLILRTLRLKPDISE